MNDDIIIGVNGSVDTMKDHVRSLKKMVGRNNIGSVQLDNVRTSACKMYPHAKCLTYDLPHYTPLGYTINESLIEEKD